MRNNKETAECIHTPQQSQLAIQSIDTREGEICRGLRVTQSIEWK